MTAPVYRHIDTQNKLFGLGFPTEAGVVAFVSVIALQVLPFFLSVLAIAASWAAILLLNRGRADSFFQHYIAFQARSILQGGRACAVGRSRAPRFPFGPYYFRSHDHGAR